MDQQDKTWQERRDERLSIAVAFDALATEQWDQLLGMPVSHPDYSITRGIAKGYEALAETARNEAYCAEPCIETDAAAVA